MEPLSDRAKGIGSCRARSNSSSSNGSSRSVSASSSQGEEAYLQPSLASRGWRFSRHCTQFTDKGHVHAIDWGIKRSQVRDLLARLRAHPDWNAENNVYTLVQDFIIPWTKGHGVSYALLLNRSCPKRINVMVSHAFSEIAEDFLEAVLQATRDGEVLYICALCNYQAEDGAGPSLADQLGDDISQSPFYGIITYLACHGREEGGCLWRWRPYVMQAPIMLCLCSVLLFLLIIANNSAMPMRERQDILGDKLPILMSICTCLWLVAFLLFLCLECRPSVYPGRMLVVPNHVSDVYQRLWCVYEMFLARQSGLHVEMTLSLAPVGKTESKTAQCSVKADERRIRGRIEACPGGYVKIDAAIRQITSRRAWHTLGVCLKYAVLLWAPAVVDAESGGVTVNESMLLFGYMAWIFCLYAVARYYRGIFPSGFLPNTLVMLISVAISIVTNYYHMSLRTDTMLQLSCEIQAVALVYTGACCQPYPRDFLVRWRIVLLIALASITCFFVHIFEDIWRTNHVLPDVKLYDNAFVTVINVLPVYMMWTESLSCGFKISEPIRYKGAVGILAWFYLMLVLCWFLWVPSFVFQWVAQEDLRDW